MFGVHIDASGVRLDVKARLSDGAVTKIEDDGSDGSGSGGESGE